MAEDTNLEKTPAEARQEPERTTTGRVFVPKMDIVETDDAITLIGDFPGVDEQGMNVTLEKNVLTIRGHVRPEVPEGYNVTYAEYAIGDFERVFTIGEEVDRDRIQAVVKNGTLRLTLPKAKRVLTQRIPVMAQ
jgi:HSP20 family molecular chaperone IbpA